MYNKRHLHVYRISVRFIKGVLRGTNLYIYFYMSIGLAFAYEQPIYIDI